jgi:hypothetical protein
MTKMRIVIVLVILSMLIPAINMTLENTDEELNAFTVETELFGEYLADKPIRTSETTISFYGSFSSGHNIDPSTITRIDAEHDYLGWYYDIENESQFIWSYIPSTNSVNLSFDDGYGVVYLNIKGNGTFYNEYWSQAFGETKIYCDGLNKDDVLFYANIFYNDPDIEYSEINSYDEREIGMTYNGNDDSTGHSAIDIGTAMFTEGLFGMFPRYEDGTYSFPLLNQAGSLTRIVWELSINMIKGWFENNMDDYGDEYDGTYYEIGTWSEPRPNVYEYTIDSGGMFGGEYIRTTNLSTTSNLYYFKCHNVFWIRYCNVTLDDDDMQDYQTETNNFE